MGGLLRGVLMKRIPFLTLSGFHFVLGMKVPLVAELKVGNTRSFILTYVTGTPFYKETEHG